LVFPPVVGTATLEDLMAHTRSLNQLRKKTLFLFQSPRKEMSPWFRLFPCQWDTPWTVSPSTTPRASPR
jgi:hypothetical protein